MSQPIIFYDIASKLWEGQTMSPNLWKGRIALNIKGVSYKTTYVEFPDIAELCTKIGAAPTSTTAGTPNYTLPAIQDPSTGAVVSDSFAIAKYLDATYPSGTTLVPPGSDAFQAMFTDTVEQQLMKPLATMIIADIPALFIPRSAEYFRRTREVWFGKRLEEVQTTPQEVWPKVFEALSRLDGYRRASGADTVFFMGDQPSWADVAVVSVLALIRLYFGKDSREWKDVLSTDDGRWARLSGAMEKWVRVEDDDIALP